MAVSSLPTPRDLRARLTAAPLGALAELAARGGYVARGFVYLSIGGVALLAALRLAPEAEGAVGALQAWGRWPMGIALLWTTGLGLYGFAFWRALQSVLDADRQGTSGKAVASRIGQAISGLVYGGLAISVFGLLDAVEDLSEADDQARTTAAIDKALALPQGDGVVIGVGLFILACGIGNMARGVRGRFTQDLDCWGGTERLARGLARAGYLARGVAFLPAGVYTLFAGLHARAGEAKGLGGALEVLKDQPFGGLILAATALGLIAFGLFAFVEARYRRIRPPKALSGAGT